MTEILTARTLNGQLLTMDIQFCWRSFVGKLNYVLPNRWRFALSAPFIHTYSQHEIVSDDVLLRKLNIHGNN